MIDAQGERASDLAARQVEQIVSAAQAAADDIREKAHADVQHISADALSEAKSTIEQAKRISQDELKAARKEAILLEQDARRDAEAIIADAEHDATMVREKAKRAVDGRVVAAERAAAEVLEEARALSGGLRQLGKALEAHADRILRDVTAAHKRMQSDLRVSPALDADVPDRTTADDDQGAGVSPAKSRRFEPADRRPQASPDDDTPGQARRRANPFEEIEVPSWVGRDA
jgi:cell division septum initiation protein DivIVA